MEAEDLEYMLDNSEFLWHFRLNWERSLGKIQIRGVLTSQDCDTGQDLGIV